MDAQQMRTSRQQLIEEPTTLADRMVNGAGADAQPALEPDFWAVHSKTGVHIGLWPNKAHADEALREYEGGTITPLFRALSSPNHSSDARNMVCDHADAGKVKGDGWRPITDGLNAIGFEIGGGYVLKLSYDSLDQYEAARTAIRSALPSAPASEGAE
ncbi:hypothetical protein [Brucella tritici]|uniref:hypothetical protein n=1 Tax=Brucella tritici TaxID=94626 RepID=UPI002000FBC2|nr:hypothetical protein [Brucella tritici]